MKLLQKALCLAPVLIASLALSPTASAQTGTHLTITQVYGAGGNSGATYTNDYVEIFNPTAGPISLVNYNIQYASSSNSTSAALSATLGTGATTSLAPGQYYLINLAGGTATNTNPTGDATGSANLSATAGKVYLVSNTTPLTSCTSTAIVDLVFYGSNTKVAGCANTNTPAPAPSATTADVRTNICTNSNVNSSDFTATTPNPHNSSTNVGSCYPADTNPASSIALSGYPTPTNRAAAHPFVVSALDSSGNVTTNYTSTVSFTSTDPAAILPAPYMFTAADKGSHTFSATFNTTGVQSITATDTNGLTSTQAGIVVNATLWIVNADTTVTHLTQGGLVLSTAGTAGSTATLAGIAVDNAGTAYAVSNAASNVTVYSPTTGALLFTSTVGGVNLPTSIAVDGAGNVWTANTNNSVSQLAVNGGTAAPTALSPATGYTGGTLSGLSIPSSIAIDSTGSVWVANSSNGSFTRFFGAAAPVVTSLVKAITAGTQGTRP